MGKKSKRRTGTSSRTDTSARAGTTSSTAPSATRPIPRQRFLFPEDWEIGVAGIHPFQQTNYQYICIDAERYISKGDGVTEISTRNRSKQIEHYGDCPVCFKDATRTCGRCGTVSYCSAECQKVHWKESHKVACQPNPNLCKFHLDLSVFRGLSEDAFEGHEFLVIRPTEQLASLQDICEQALEAADDIFDIPGFGSDLLNPSWLFGQSSHPAYQAMVLRFGWTSKRFCHEPLYGYRVAESRIIYFILYDDCFQTELSMAPSYYGEALFPPLPPGKKVRGNCVIYKAVLKEKVRQASQGSALLNLTMTDDADLHYEYVVLPSNKAEIALLLSERRKAQEQGAYTARMWRHSVRFSEIEEESKTKNPGMNFLFNG